MGELLTMTDQQFQIIMSRLDKIERQLDPARSANVEQKAAHIRKAIASGDRAKVRQAVREINGGRK